MGSICSQCFQSMNKAKQSQQQPPVKEREPPETNRSLAKGTQVKEEKNESVFGRVSSITSIDGSSVKGDFKCMKSTKKNLSTVGGKQFTSEQFTLEPGSVIIKDCEQSKSSLPPEQFYTVIEKLAFVRRSGDNIRIYSIEGQSQLNCPPQFKISTYSILEGKPIDSIKQISLNCILQTSVSPIKVSLKLACKGCKKQHKLTFCKGMINLGVIACSNCEVKGSWTLLDISSNAPMWADGRKIDNHDEMETAPSIIRVMGCVNCRKFTACKNMSCGCLICQECLDEDPQRSVDMMCEVCQEGLQL